MKFWSALAALTAVSMHHLAMAKGAPTTVFELPLGAQIQPIKTCSVAQLSGAPTQHPCWVSEPWSSPTGIKHGGVLMPRPERLPLWAEHADFKFSITSDGILDAIFVEADGGQKMDIARSISKRFGLPKSNNLNDEFASGALWDLPAGFGISLACFNKCITVFSSPRAMQAEKSARAAKEAANSLRPATP